MQLVGLSFLLGLLGRAASGSDIRLRTVRAAVKVAIAVLTAIDQALTLLISAASAATKSLSAKSATDKPSVVIVGGAFAGLRVQRELSDDFDVTVVDRKDFFEYTPGILRLFTQPHKLGSLSTPIPCLRNRLQVGEATAVSAEAVRVRTSEGTKETEVPYDYLVLACGAEYNAAPIKATAEQQTLASRQEVWDAAAATLRAAPAVVVVGGGLVGVELAAEIAEAHPDKQLTLLNRGGRLCATLPGRVGYAARKWLEARGVQVRLHANVEAVDADAGVVRLQSGEELRAAAVYDCRGNGEPNTARLEWLEGVVANGAAALDASGRASVDETLRSGVGGGRIFAAGDTMALASCGDLKLGHTAELNAEVVAHNIRALAFGGEGGALEPYPRGAVGGDVTPRVFCVSLGEAYGILVFNSIILEGSLAAIVKALLEWTKIAACAERPVGVLFWKFADGVTALLTRTVLPPPRPPKKRPLILFDGVCLLCATFIHFVLDHDVDEIFDFAALQSEYGRAKLAEYGMAADLSTMVLIDDDGAHVRSTGVLRVLSRCGAPYSLLYAAMALPRPLRDLGYKTVAALRYRLFGEDDGTTCRRMTKHLRKRFLDLA